jgi:hypothetical protein
MANEVCACSALAELGINAQHGSIIHEAYEQFREIGEIDQLALIIAWKTHAEALNQVFDESMGQTALALFEAILAAE